MNIQDKIEILVEDGKLLKCKSSSTTAEIIKLIEKAIPKERDEANSPFSNRELAFVDGWNAFLAEIRRRLTGGE